MTILVCSGARSVSAVGAGGATVACRRVGYNS